MKKMSKKLVLLFLVAVVLISLVMTTTLAYLQDSTEVLTNTFNMADVTTQIEEEVGKTKKVYILNQGESEAYVRVRLSFSGLTKEQMDKIQVVSNATAQASEYQSEDHIVILTQGDWRQTSAQFNPDGFFYYKSYVSPENKKEDQKPLEIVVGSNAGVGEDLEVLVYHESVVARAPYLTDVTKIAAVFEESSATD